MWLVSLNLVSVSAMDVLMNMCWRGVLPLKHEPQSRSRTGGESSEVVIICRCCRRP